MGLFQADPKLKYIQESPIWDFDHFLTFRCQFGVWLIKWSWGKFLADRGGHAVAYWQAMQFEGYFVVWIGFPFEDWVTYV